MDMHGLLSLRKRWKIWHPTCFPSVVPPLCGRFLIDMKAGNGHRDQVVLSLPANVVLSPAQSRP
jgi:hypothetical protein